MWLKFCRRFCYKYCAMLVDQSGLRKFLVRSIQKAGEILRTKEFFRRISFCVVDCYRIASSSPACPLPQLLFADVTPKVLEGNTLSSCSQVLSGEIFGVRTFSCAQAPNSRLKLQPKAGTISVLFIVRGSGFISADSNYIFLTPWPVFISAFRYSYSIGCSGDSSLEYVKIVNKLTWQDILHLEAKSDYLPYIIDYENCKNYKELIKSENSINRILVPETLIPRFCMGSVESYGPGEVLKHLHPML